MADQKISAMDPAGALTGAEVVPVVQGGANARTTLSDVVAYGNALVTLSTLGASVNGITLIGHTFAQMRADLDLEAGTDFYSIAAADAAISSGASAAVSTHVGLADPHTQYLLESAVSANGLTLIGHTFAQMRADLSLVVGTDVQAYNANLTTYAAVAPSANAQTLLGHTFSQMRTDLGLVIGTDVQAYSANLATYAGVAPSANAQTLLGHTFAQMRSDLSLGTAALVADSTLVHITGNETITGAKALGSQANASYFSAVFAAPQIMLSQSDTTTTAGGGAGPLAIINPDTTTNNYACILFGSVGTNSNVYANAGIGAQFAARAAGYHSTDLVLFTGTTAGTQERVRIAAAGGATFSSSIAAGGPVNLKSYTVAGLPAGTTGDIAYASNGRKNGEGAAAGTGVMVFKDGTAWRACDTGATVAA